MKKFIAITSAAFLATAASGCASNPADVSATGYYAAQSRQLQTVLLGTVLSINPIKIAPDSTLGGTAAGAVVGGLAGSLLGQGAGRTIMEGAGAVAGAVAGSAAQGAGGATDGSQITIQLDNHRVVSVAQAADRRIKVGDRVQILGGQGQPSRVMPL